MLIFLKISHLIQNFSMIFWITIQNLYRIFWISNIFTMIFGRLVGAYRYDNK